MKKRLLFILSYASLLALAVLGVAILGFAPREERISDGENRMLAAFPEASLSSVRSGAFMDGFEEYLSDAFPARDDLTALSRRVLGLFGERDEDYALREAIAREERSEAPPENETEPAAPDEEAPETTPAPETETPPPEDGEDMPAPSGRDATVWLVKPNGQTEERERYYAEKLEHLAPVLDEYRACLPEDGKVLFINAPISAYANAITLHRAYVDWGSDIDQALQPMVGEGVVIYNAEDIFRPYLGVDNLYSDSDHHWDGPGAWHAVEAMIRDVGYPAQGYYDYKYRLAGSFRGPFYTPEQMQTMDIRQGNWQVPIPVTPVESYILKYMTKRSPSVYLESDLIKGYGLYLGGKQRPWRLFETGYHTGRTALVIGDCFYHAFVPYLTPYYDRILATDLRYDMYIPKMAGGSIRQYIEHYGIDDVYFVMCSYTSLNGYVYQDRMELYLNTDYGAIYGRGDE